MYEKMSENEAEVLKLGMQACLVS